ncbi:hypothetical protein [Lysinibacillus sp. fls2-241-R2A-57]|uniref:hypothetical protein n=1 Tax=Lysinibacillus sp. fls2-241-R2A-57 TaxID=3040292 RepID=UPI002556ACD0|nr:hypothetical protein [Lysinibacillus sp. fls2-241-R2A-57]
MSTSDLMQKKSRITIFNEPVICRFCSNDVFIPYEVYANVEQPGIGVYHVRNIAICQHCGETKYFGDPSYYDAEKDTYIWALNQYLLSDTVRKYKIKVLLYVGKRNNDRITSFINKLVQDFSIEVENMSDLKGGVVLQMKLSSLNDIQTIRSIIIDSAKRLNITIKDLTIK